MKWGKNGKKTYFCNMRLKYKSREIEEDVLGDRRIKVRHPKLVESLSQGFGESVPSKPWHALETKAMYRFFAKEQVTPEKQLHWVQKEIENALKTQISPILGRLIPTLPIENATDAVEGAHDYALRWVPERFPFLLKSGSGNVELLQLQNLHRLKKAIPCSSMAVLNALKIHFAAKNQPEMPAFEVGGASKQDQALCFYRNNTVGELRLDPKIPPSVAVFAVNLAKIVGFKPSKTNTGIKNPQSSFIEAGNYYRSLQYALELTLFLFFG
jgi:hypothetical protein